MSGLMLAVGSGLTRNAGVAQTQRAPDPIMPPSAQSGVLPSEDPGMPILLDGPIRARINEDRINALNEARHKRLEDDAEKLMELSSALKSDVDKTNKDELSVEVMRKAAEIEKLAHDVQNRMKN